jgi:hypothetical protein
VLELLGQWGIFGFGTVATVGYILFWNWCDSVVYLVLEPLRQWGIFGFGTVTTVGYILFWNCCDSGVYFVLELTLIPQLFIVCISEGLNQSSTFLWDSI